MDRQIITTAIANGRFWGLAAADWAEIQEKTCQPVYLAAFEHVALRPGTQYLDLGCGSGLAAWLAAERGAQISGLDAAENLLEVARVRVPTGDFRLGQLESLPYSDASFDLVTGFNSFQYAANPVGALAEAKRVARSGAKVLVMIWGRPEGMGAASLVTAIKPLLPPPPPGAAGPFALSEETALKGFAETAGLEVIEMFDVESPWQYANLDQALRGLRSSGVAAKAIENSSVEAVDKAHTEALMPFRQPDGSYRIDASFRCLVTRA